MTGVATIERGAILAYRVFDAGDAIALDVAEARVKGSSRVDMSGPLAEGLVVPSRPLEIPLGSCTFTVARPHGAPGDPFTFEATARARVFDFGGVSVEYEIPLEPGTTLASLVAPCDALYDAPELDVLGVRHRAEVMQRLGDAIDDPHGWSEAETYTIVFAERIDGCTVAELRRSETLAKLLIGETSDKTLAEAVRNDALQNAFSYFVDDLLVFDWNSAFVFEPSGSRVTPRVLELATAQLLEFRYYDGLLDRELAKVYAHVERTRTSIFRSPYRVLTRQVVRRFMELTEVTERVDNAIKSVGDFHLAYVYRAALARFRVPDWRESVETKLDLVAKAYELLKGEVEVSRSQLLEITVVILILVEVVAAYRGH